MAIEYELKFQATETVLEQIFAQYGENPCQSFQMETTYYDTPSGFAFGESTSLITREARRCAHFICSINSQFYFIIHLMWLQCKNLSGKTCSDKKFLSQVIRLFHYWKGCDTYDRFLAVLRPEDKASFSALGDGPPIPQYCPGSTVCPDRFLSERSQYCRLLSAPVHGTGDSLSRMVGGVFCRRQYAGILGILGK